MPIVFTSGQAFPCPSVPTLVAWIWDPEPLSKEPLSDLTPHPTIPLYEKLWLSEPFGNWDRQGLVDKIDLRTMPNKPDTTMLVLNGPRRTQKEIGHYFNAVAESTELTAGWGASTDGLEEWATKLADVDLPLSPYAKALVRWIAALDHIAKQWSNSANA